LSAKGHTIFAGSRCSSLHSFSLAHRGVEEVMLEPLGEYLQKLYRAQRALIRRKRRRRDRISFTHSTTGRGPKAGEAKRSPRRLKPVDTQQAILAVPRSLKDNDIKKNVQSEQNNGAYLLLGWQDVSSSKNESHRHSNPPRNGHVAPGNSSENWTQWGIVTNFLSRSRRDQK